MDKNSLTVAQGVALLLQTGSLQNLIDGAGSDNEWFNDVMAVISPEDIVRLFIRTSRHQDLVILDELQYDRWHDVLNITNAFPPDVWDTIDPKTRRFLQDKMWRIQIRVI